jgi:hypothetical protein
MLKEMENKPMTKQEIEALGQTMLKEHGLSDANRVHGDLVRFPLTWGEATLHFLMGQLGD